MSKKCLYRGRQSHFRTSFTVIHYNGKDPVGQVVPVHHLQGGTRGTRSSAAPEVARPFYIFQLVPTLGPSTCVQIPFGVPIPQLVRPFLLEQQLHEQFLVMAHLLFCVWDRVGSLRFTSPIESTIWIHSLSACTFPLLAIIYLKHYLVLYSCK